MIALKKVFVKASRRIRGLVKNFEAWNVMWLRGMVPRELLAEFEGPEIHNARIWQSEGFVRIVNRSGLGYSD